MNTNDIKISNHVLRYSKDRYIYPLFTKTGDKIIIQTTYLYIPIKPRCFNTRYNEIMRFYLSFNNIEKNEHSTKLLDFLLKLNVRCENFISKESCTWNSSLKDDSSSPLLVLNCYDKDKLSIYNSLKQKVLIDDIKDKTFARAIIFIDGIWVNTNTKSAGLDISILQLQLHDRVFLEEFSFLDEIIPTTTTVKTQVFNFETHPIVGKYFKMLTMGIPEMAVRQKLKIDGLPESVLDAKSINDLGGLSQSVDVFADSIKEGIDLKQCLPTAGSQKRKTNEFTVSEEEIKNVLNRLKKTGSKLVPQKDPQDSKKENVKNMLAKLLILRK
jgi:hypothetical protein